MTIYDYLSRNKTKRKSFRQTEDFAFYYENRSSLAVPQKFSKYTIYHDEFDVIRANIIFQGLLNKQLIESEIKEYSELKKPTSKYAEMLESRLIDRNYYQLNKNSKIYIPFFSKTLNMVYNETPEKLLNPPYSNLLNSFRDNLVDPFDTYGYKLFGSYFTRLILVDESVNEAAFFHYDTNTIYIINEQGRLNNKIVLFDKYLAHPNYNHMLERIKDVVKYYFVNDKDEFIKALISNKFVSRKLISKYRWKMRNK